VNSRYLIGVASKIIGFLSDTRGNGGFGRRHKTDFEARGTETTLSLIEEMCVKDWTLTFCSLYIAR